ncbi:hypothetical protein AX16_007427 [Volvariella volvacea WC 439]|nr:hypothetical protein AX16_007427 [Volvariella volvacea WC 439]
MSSRQRSRSRTRSHRSTSSSGDSSIDSTDTADIRASVLNVCIQLGALDDNGRVADWMFTDPQQPLQRDYSSYPLGHGMVNAIRRGRSRVLKFNSNQTAAHAGGGGGATSSAGGTSMPSSRGGATRSIRGEDDPEDHTEQFGFRRRGNTGNSRSTGGGLESISSKLAATFGFRSRGRSNGGRWRNSFLGGSSSGGGASSDTEDNRRSKPMAIRSIFTRRSRSLNPNLERRKPPPPAPTYTRSFSTSSPGERGEPSGSGASSPPRQYHYQKSRPPSLDEDWEKVSSPTSSEAWESNVLVSERSLTVRRLTSRPLEYYTARHQRSKAPVASTSSGSSTQIATGKVSGSEPVSPSELGTLPTLPALPALSTLPALSKDVEVKDIEVPSAAPPIATVSSSNSKNDSRSDLGAVPPLTSLPKLPKENEAPTRLAAPTMASANLNTSSQSELSAPPSFATLPPLLESPGITSSPRSTPTPRARAISFTKPTPKFFGTTTPPPTHSQASKQDNKVFNVPTFTPSPIQTPEPQPISFLPPLGLPTGPIKLEPIKLEAIPEVRSSRFIEGTTTPSIIPTTPAATTSSRPSSPTPTPTPRPASPRVRVDSTPRDPGDSNANLSDHNTTVTNHANVNFNVPPTPPTSPTSTSTIFRARSQSPSSNPTSQTQFKFRPRFRTISRFSLPSMRSATSFATPSSPRARNRSSTVSGSGDPDSQMGPIADSEEPELASPQDHLPASPPASPPPTPLPSPSSSRVPVFLPLPEIPIGLGLGFNPNHILRSQPSHNHMHVLMASMSSPNLSSSGLASFPSP